MTLAALVWIAFAQTAPPKGTTWKDTLDAGKSDASSRKTPIVMFVFDKSYDKSVQMYKAFEDVKVAAVLKSFSCVCVSRDFDAAKMRQSYIPWIAAQASSNYDPPVVAFGNSKGDMAPEFRLEGKVLSAEELVEHLLKVLNKLAPEKVEAARTDMLMLAPMADLVKMLEDAMGKLSDNLNADKVNVFQDELKNTQGVARVLGMKLDGLKDKKLKPEAHKQAGILDKELEKLVKFKGKDVPGYKPHLDKAKEALDAIKKIVDEAKE
jgi:hypothetical protein